MSKRIFFVVCVIVLVISASACSVSADKNNKQQSAEDNAQDSEVSFDVEEQVDTEENILDENEEDIDVEVTTIENSLTNDDIKNIEELISTFVDYARNFDGPSIVGLFALNEEVEGYNAELVAEWLRVTVEELDPPTQESRINDIDNMLTRFYFGFYAHEQDIAEKLKNETLTGDDVLNTISCGDYSTIYIKRIDSPVEWLYGTEGYEQLVSETSERYGFQNKDFRTALLELNGKTFFCGFTLYKYNDTWMIHSLDCSTYAIVNPNFLTAPITEKEYEELLSNK